MATKKCKCEECAFCKIIYCAVNKWVICEEYKKEMIAPIYCDKFITLKEYRTQQKDYDRQTKHTKYFWQIVDEWEGK